jgi:hypothetical protein
MTTGGGRPAEGAGGVVDVTMSLTEENTREFRGPADRAFALVSPQ